MTLSQEAFIKRPHGLRATLCQSGEVARRSVLLLLFFAVVAYSMINRVAAAERFAEYDLAMYARPTFPVGKRTVVFSSGLKELWVKALARPDAELQRMVIDTLAIAHRRGVKGIADTKPRLLELLSESNQRADVLRAAVQTLIELDARDQAETFAALSAQHGVSVAQIVEPALARWKSQAMQETWLQRVSDASSGQTLMILAINGLGALEDDQAVNPLEKAIQNSGETIQVRLAAARALGKVRSTGSVEFAQSLIDQPSRPVELHSLVAIELLSKHDDDGAVELLTNLISDESTVVQSRSLSRLYEIDIDLVDAHADVLISSEDANVRRWCARAMIAKKSVDRVKMLCSLLDDVNPSLRREVADGLLNLAELPGFRDEVIERTTEIVNRNDWRGCEQAVVVLAKLDHKPSGERMVELLGHARGDVQVASAWGLTQLRIKELLPDMLEHAQSVYDGFQSNQLSDNMPGVSLHVAHLFIAFGDQRFREADALMRKYLPKNFTLGNEARGAAAWAFGLIYEDDPQEDLAKILVGRLNDSGGPNPEIDEVRWTSAVSLGRMKAESSLPDLRKHAPSLDRTGQACYWAIERMTGESPPPVSDSVGETGDWFLSPLKDQ